MHPKELINDTLVVNLSHTNPLSQNIANPLSPHTNPFSPHTNIEPNLPPTINFNALKKTHYQKTRS